MLETSSAKRKRILNELRETEIQRRAEGRVFINPTAMTWTADEIMGGKNDAQS
jgi:hypothetical protein